MNNAYFSEAKSEWDQAKRKAFFSQLSHVLTRRDNHLVDFAEVSARLGLKNQRYLGIDEVPLEQIVGSVGRYQDFTKNFLPTTRKMEQRWARVAGVYLDPLSSGVPPIELYKVGANFFVKDGNHRVSVARQFEMPTIEAHVWEYPIQLPDVDSESTVDDLLIAAEKQDFLESTGLDHTRPDHNIQLTVPGGYRELLHEIADYQHALETIDGVRPSFGDAAAYWYDVLYTLTLMVCDRTKALERFPDRTAADVYIFTRRRQEALRERYGVNATTSQTARALGYAGAVRPKRLWWRIKSLFKKES